MVRGGDAHPALGGLRGEVSGPLGKTYPLADAGQAIADGIEGRTRWVVVPSWGRALLVLRTVLAPVFERFGSDMAVRADAIFQEDVEARGAEAASQPVGPGGAAASGAAGGDEPTEVHEAAAERA
jgi:hypothetical protein